MLEEQLMVRNMSNASNSNMSLVINPLQDVKQTSYFQHENKDSEFLSKWMETVEMPAEVPIPTEPIILSSEYGYLADAEKVPLEFMKAMRWR